MNECKGCGQDIIWMKTPKGKSIPVDPDDTIADEPGQTFDAETMTSHFSTCPEADSFRKKRPA